MDHLIVITGSMGTGKTTVLGEASDMLAERDIAHAAIDLDALGLAHEPAVANASDELTLRNLKDVCSNVAAAGIRRVLIAAAVESRAELDRIVRATAARTVLVCRLRAALEVMEARVAARERGIRADRYVRRVRVLEDLLDHAALEDFSLATTDVPVTAVARTLLERAEWLPG